MKYWDLHCDMTFSPFGNLCSHFNWHTDDLFKLVTPTDGEIAQLVDEKLPPVYWGRGGFIGVLINIAPFVKT